MKPAAIESFFATLQAANPSPQTELVYTSVFELLTAVLCQVPRPPMSASTRLRVSCCPVANTPQTVLALGQDGLGHQEDDWPIP